MSARDDELPSWPTIATMMAAALAGLVICTGRLFGKMQPRCASCSSNELGGRFVIAGRRMCSTCFGSLRVPA